MSSISGQLIESKVYTVYIINIKFLLAVEYFVIYDSDLILIKPLYILYLTCSLYLWMTSWFAFLQESDATSETQSESNSTSVSSKTGGKLFLRESMVIKLLKWNNYQIKNDKVRGFLKYKEKIFMTYACKSEILRLLKR